MTTSTWDPDLIDFLRWSHDLRGLADNTLRVRIDLLRRFADFLAPVRLRDATQDNLLAFEKAAILGRSAETRRVYAVHIRSFYRWLQTSEQIAKSPATVLTMPLLPRHLPRPIEEPDLYRALAAARPKLRTMIVLEAWAGLRCCEVAGLEWPDLRRELDGRAYLHVRGKGNRERVVDVGLTVVRALQSIGVRRRGPVFLGVDGGQITANAVSRTINRHLHRLDIDATAHSLRHRYATVGYEITRDLRLIQEQLGHASANTTAIYTRPSAEAAARMVRAMDDLAPPA